ncbi:MAG: hypothetical protein GX921_08590 [Bacteroidales bacterium]|nr:hypothetical protein [Bacteroidales bacterium]
MKKIFFTLTLAVFAVSMFFSSCGDSSRKADNPQKTVADSKLGKLDVEIPASLRDKPEVVAYIHDMNKVADEYAILIDKALEDFGGYENLDFDDLSMMDKIKVMKASAEIGLKSMDMMAKWAEHHDRLNIYKEDLSEDETLALETVVNRFGERMKQIEKKHTKYFDQE